MVSEVSRRWLLAAAILVSVCALMGCEEKPVEDRPINVVFRMDDYSAGSSTEMELKVIDAFREHHAPVTIAVIPFVAPGEMSDGAAPALISLTEEKVSILKQGIEEGVLDVALHGYCHQSLNAERLSEFGGLDYGTQVERLAKGRALLEGLLETPVTLFVPPFNHYDHNTLCALESLGLTAISAGTDGVASEDCKLDFLPAVCNLLLFRQAIQTARTSGDKQPIVVVLFHLFDFREVNQQLGRLTLPEFRDHLKWLRSQPDIRLLSVSQAIETIEGLNAHRLLRNKRDHAIEGLLPSALRGRGYWTRYYECSVLPRVVLRVGGFYLAITLLGAALALAAGRLAFSRAAFIARTSRLASVVLLVIVLVWAFYDLKAGPKDMTAGFGVLGVVLGLQLSKSNRIAGPRCLTPPASGQDDESNLDGVGPAV